MHLRRPKNAGVVLLVLGLAWGSACDESEAGVLVNVQLESADLQVSELRLRGYAASEQGQVLEVTRSREDGELFGPTENLYVEVPRSWIGRIVWLQAEGKHEGVVTAHGSVSVLPRRNAVVEATLVLVAGASPCGNGVVDPGEQCDGTELGDHSCVSFAGLPNGLLRCVDCQIDAAACHDCGNGLIEAGPEACDGENLGGESCASQGFVTGELACTSDCRLDRSACEQGCGNSIMEEGEACDGADLGRLSCADLGFLWGHLSCTTDCGLDTTGCVGTCGDGVLDPLEDCDGTDFGAQTCLSAAGRDAGSLVCTSDCHLDVSDCHECGNGIIEVDEQCDGPSLRGETCLTRGHAGGVLSCTPDCTYDESLCGASPCGNGALDAGEQCDGSNLDGESCASLGLGTGALACHGSCLFDTGGCSPVVTACGNGLVEAGEQCDDGNLVPADGCDATCQVEGGYHCYDDPSICVADGSVLFVDCAGGCPGSGSLVDPYCSIQNAVGNAVNGQLIWLLAASCVEDVLVGPTDADVIFAGDPGTVWSGTSCPALKADERQVLVYGLHLIGGVEANGTSGSLTVRRCEIGPSTSTCQAVLCIDQAYCELLGNHIHDNAEGGVWMNGATFRIVNNIIVDNGTPGSSRRGGLSLDTSGASPAELVNNTIAFNSGRGSPFISGVNCLSSLQVRNNILWMNDTPEISATCDPWYNVMSEPSWDGVQGNMDLDPLFIDMPAGDYHIQPLSPCVDSADPAGIPPAPAGDYDGQSRFLGLGVDIGADEAS